MIHVFRYCTAGAVACALALPAAAGPVIGFGGHVAPPRLALDLPPLTVNCEDPEPPEPEEPSEEPSEGEGSEGEGSGGSSEASASGPERLYLACDGKGQNYDLPGQTGFADAVEARVEIGIDHCGAYSDVWRVDCLSDELQRVANKLPNDSRSRRAKAEIRAAAERLRALAAQNADPAQPAVRRAAEVEGVRRTTSRPIVAVAPDRVAATNAAADQIISDLSTTLLRSASGAGASDFTRVAAAVDSTKVLLRST